MSGRAPTRSRIRRCGCRSAARAAPSEAAERGITIGVLNTGWARTPAIFEAYRKKAREAGREPTPDKLAYMALIGVGETREEGQRRADQILDYSRTSGIVAPQFANPPGYVPAAGAAQMLKGGGAMAARATRVQTQGRHARSTRARCRSRTRSTPASPSPAPPTMCSTSSARSTTMSAASGTS